MGAAAFVSVGVASCRQLPHHAACNDTNSNTRTFRLLRNKTKFPVQFISGSIQCCFTSTETVRTVVLGTGPRTTTSTFTQLLSELCRSPIKCINLYSCRANSNRVKPHAFQLHKGTPVVNVGVLRSLADDAKSQSVSCSCGCCSVS